MALFVGEFETQIDPSKRRLAIPAALREGVDPDDGDGWILSLGPDRHLWLYPDGVFRRMLADRKRTLVPSRQDRRLSMIFAMARHVKPDAQGRVVLPEKSMQRAQTSENVTLVGAEDHIEVWPTDEWEKEVDSILPDYGEFVYGAGEPTEGDLGRTEGA